MPTEVIKEPRKISTFAMAAFFVVFGAALLVAIPYSKIIVAVAAIVAGVALLIKR